MTMKRREFISQILSLPLVAVIPKVIKATVPKELNKLSSAIRLATQRGSAILLENLGLTINVSESYRRYAESLNKPVYNLTDSERQMAVLNEILNDR